MTIDEIFKGQEHLLNEPAIKLLLSEIKTQYDDMYKRIRNSRSFYDQVLNVFVGSGRVMIEGTTDTETLDKIEKLLDEN
jgi:hypothetical protein